MAKVFLTHSYFYFFDPKQWKTAKPYPPLGTLFAAAVLREAGHEVIFFDNGLQKSIEPALSAFQASQAEVFVIYDDGFNYLTKMCLTNMREAAFEMGRAARKMNIPAVVSSSDSTDHYKEYLHKAFDYVLIGEAEHALADLLEGIEAGSKNIEEIEGLAFMKEESALKTRPRKTLRDLDKLPDPAWDLLDVEPYRNIWIKNHGMFSINVSTTRGCPYKCNWCAKPIYGNVYNSRSPERVAKEMAMLTERFEVDEFWMTDDIFGLKRNWVQEFEKEVRKTGKTFSYRIQSRVDLMLRDNNLEAMVNSGMEEVWVGAESGSQKILDAMDKGITVEQIREATRKVREHGKRICFFLQFGYLGEEEEDIQQTIELLLELMPDDIGISVSYPLPGTGFFEKVRDQMGLKENWSDSDDLDTMYTATYNKAFYKSLHRLVHKLYRRKQGMEYLGKPLRDWSGFGNEEIRSILLSLLYYSPMSYIDRARTNSLMQKTTKE